MKYDVQKWKSLVVDFKQEKLNKFCPEYDTFMSTIIDPVVRRQFSHISTKMMYKYNNGYMPLNYVHSEKQQSAGQVPHWNKENCIQCTICASSCPHSSIRPFVINTETEQGKSLPADLETLDYKGKTEIFGSKPENTKFTIQVSEADCRGCGVCAQACPKKCLEMKDLSSEIQHQPTYEWAHDQLHDTQG